ncbi:Response regulator protein TmoT [Pandoraea iniqua]|uniref:response regulator n=1 Tax=Pandoraea iniqua TaxID=2508288 RepID=UPI00123F825C|nr:response regulator [Pandoraea iniqua]VVD75820.1 Response regulator protein TmoT [Pandoraea iniqua]
MTTPRKLIAILEDDTGMRRAVERLLKLYGFRTRSFAGADDVGLVQCVGSAYCLVADVQLPGTSGPAFFATLPHPRPPVVFVTAYDNDKTRADIGRIGVAELLTKPFLGGDLLAAIERAARTSS